MLLRITKIEIDGLWGRSRPIDMALDPTVNVLIGPNGCGKTTVLKLLHAVVSLDLRALSDIAFRSISVGLEGFDGSIAPDLRVTRDEDCLTIERGKLRWEVRSRRTVRGDSLFEVHDEESRTKRRRGQASPAALRHEALQSLREQIRNVIPLAWLPVSRRLPIAEDDDQWDHPMFRAQYRQAESVDACLQSLSRELATYRLRLETQASALHKEFERGVLQLMLVGKDEDVGELELRISEDDTRLLESAFESAGLLTPLLRQRIREHFDAAKDAIEALRSSDRAIVANQFAHVFLFSRTRRMAQYAKVLEDKRATLFGPLGKFETLATSFLAPKTVEVSAQGSIAIRTPEQRELEVYQLSSGEKQILILLTQALLYEPNPVVYIADEPELSLHIKWQEKLLLSLLELGGEIQLIVATHSPDIVGPFGKKVIDLGNGR